MSHLSAALKFVLPWEGGYVDDPDDPGGATNYGVSLRYARTLYPDLDLDKDNDGDIDADDMKLLSERDAMEIYAERIWLPKHYDEIASEQVAVRIFDAAVNMGSRQAARCAQRAVNCVLGHERLSVDGVLGGHSYSAINNIRPNEFLPAFRADRWAVYREISQKSPILMKYLRGWTRRALA